MTDKDQMAAAVAALREKAKAYAHAKAHELRLEDEAPGKLYDAIVRTIGTHNPLTDKPHSASSAETAAKQYDTAYLSHLAEKRDAVVETIVARAEYEVALIRARWLGGHDVAE